MKRLLIAVFCCIMLFITLGASAEASSPWSRATNAVERKIANDNYMRDTSQVSALCDHRPTRGRYLCDVRLHPFKGDNVTCTGTASATPRGNRFSVSYRIYWGDC